MTAPLARTPWGAFPFWDSFCPRLGAYRAFRCPRWDFRTQASGRNRPIQATGPVDL